MQITVNGEQKKLASSLNIGGLLRELSVDSSRVAVELNGAIVPRSTYGDTHVNDGDAIEIVQFIGGG